MLDFLVVLGFFLMPGFFRMLNGVSEDAKFRDRISLPDGFLVTRKSEMIHTVRTPRGTTLAELGPDEDLILENGYKIAVMGDGTRRIYPPVPKADQLSSIIN